MGGSWGGVSVCGVSRGGVSRGVGVPGEGRSRGGEGVSVVPPRPRTRVECGCRRGAGRQGALRGGGARGPAGGGGGGGGAGWEAVAAAPRWVPAARGPEPRGMAGIIKKQILKHLSR